MNEVNESLEETGISPVKGARKSGFTFWIGLMYGFIVIGAQMVGGLIAALLVLPFFSFSSDNYLPAVMGVALIISFPLAVWFILRFRKLATTAWAWEKKYWLLLVIGVVAIYAMSWVVGSLIELLPNYEKLVEDYSQMFEGFNPILLFIGGAIIGPICEEIIFRGVILKELMLRYDYKKAILFSAIIFSVIHMMPIQMISTFFVGVILGYIYYKTRSLWIVCIIHIINNAVAFALGTDDMVGEETTREWFGNDLLFFGSIVLALGVIYLMYGLFERYHGIAEPEETTVLT